MTRPKPGEQVTPRHRPEQASGLLQLEARIPCASVLRRKAVRASVSLAVAAARTVARGEKRRARRSCEARKGLRAGEIRGVPGGWGDAMRDDRRGRGEGVGTSEEDPKKKPEASF